MNKGAKRLKKLIKILPKEQLAILLEALRSLKQKEEVSK